jgi:hypothetical protein
MVSRLNIDKVSRALKLYGILNRHVHLLDDLRVQRFPAVEGNYHPCAPLAVNAMASLASNHLKAGL